MDSCELTFDPDGDSSIEAVKAIYRAMGCGASCEAKTTESMRTYKRVIGENKMTELKHPKYDEDAEIHWRQWAMQQAVILHHGSGLVAATSVVNTAKHIYQWTVNGKR